MSTGGTNKFYHLFVVVRQSRPGQNRNEAEYNLSAAELERRFVVPYGRDNPIVVSGRTIPMADLERIRVYTTDGILANPTNANLDSIPEVTNDFFSLAPGMAQSLAPGLDAPEVASSPASVQRPPADAREVFVVHGRNGAARDAMFQFLRALGLDPLEWSEARRRTGKPTPYTGEILDVAFRDAPAVLVLFTPDDDARLREPLRQDNDPPHEFELRGQARPNVLFEAGMAMGRDPDHTILVELGQLRPFSDIAGRHMVRLNNSSERRHELALRLESAGCPVRMTRQDWFSVGDFDTALALSGTETGQANRVTEQETIPSETEQLSDEARELLIEASKDRQGAIFKIGLMVGTMIQTNHKKFGELGSPRSEAKWKQALDDLCLLGLVEYSSGDMYQLTKKGFDLADALVHRETPPPPMTSPL